MGEIVSIKERYCEANASKFLPLSSISQSSIDFPSNNKNKEAVKDCDHFSIRGYVADIRSRDWESCWPFAPPADKKKSDEHLADVLPPLDIPKFRFWDCQRCVQPSDVSDNAVDVSSLVLEMICIGRKDVANTLVDVSRSENGPTSNNSKENRDITMPDIRGENGVSIEVETWQNLKSTDFLTLNRRKFCPYESSDDEEENTHKLNGQHSDPSQISRFKKKQKFRLLSSIVREEKFDVSSKFFNSKTKIVQTKASHRSDSLVLYDQTAFQNCTLEKNKKRKAHEDKDHDILPVRCSKSLAKNYVHGRENDIQCSYGLYSNDESQIPENAIHGLVSQNQINYKKTLSEDRTNYMIMGTKGHTEQVELPVAYWGLKNKKVSKVKGGMSLKQKNANQLHLEESTSKPKNISLLCNSEKKKKKKNRSNYKADKMGQLDVDGVSLEIVDLLANSRHKRYCQEVQNADQIKSRKSVNLKKTEDILRICAKTSKKIPKTCKNSRLDENQMLKSPDNNGSLASSSSCLNQSDGTQFIKPSTGAKVGDQVHRWNADKFIKQKPIPYWQCGKSHSNNLMISHPADMQGSNHVLEPPCACAGTQKIIGNSARPVVPSDRYANRYMPATELLQLMDAGMCPKIPEPEKLNQIPIQKTDFSKNQLSFSSGSTKSASKRDFTNSLDKGRSNLSMRYPSDPMINPLSGRNEESQIMASDTIKSVMKKGKKYCSSVEVDFEPKNSSCGNEDLGNKNDPIFTNVMPLRLESLSLEHRLTFYPVATLQHIHGNLGIERCSMNRNAADFTVPGPGNRFMIGSRELKLGKMGRPRKGIVKLLDLNEHAPN